MSTTVALSRNPVAHVGGFVHRKKELPNDFEWNITRIMLKSSLQPVFIIIMEVTVETLLYFITNL